MLAPIT